MKGFLIIYILATLFFPFSVFSQNVEKDTFCINQKEKDLLKLINDYRKSKNLPAIKLSPSLTNVAKIHAHDLTINNPNKGKCNMHSWSDKGNWIPCCYTDDHKNADKMWSKPSELTNYKSNGYEIAYQSSDEAVPVEALSAWKKSPGHNMVITEKGVFNKMKWKAIGIAIEGNYALVWFGTLPDNEASLLECK